MKTYKPLQTTFKIDEDAGFIQDQIQDRVNSESNYEWAKKSLITLVERVNYYKELGKNYENTTQME